MSKKKFDQVLYDTVASEGEFAILRYFINQDSVKRVDMFPFGKYGVDLRVGFVDGIAMFVECEVRENWSYGDFPFSTIHIPIRKLGLKKHFPLVYAVIRKDLKKVIFILDPFKDYTIVDNPNKYVKDSESFVNLSIDNLKYIDI